MSNLVLALGLVSESGARSFIVRNRGHDDEDSQAFTTRNLETIKDERRDGKARTLLGRFGIAKGKQHPSPPTWKEREYLAQAKAVKEREEMIVEKLLQWGKGRSQQVRDLVTRNGRFACEFISDGVRFDVSGTYSMLHKRADVEACNLFYIAAE